MRGSLMPRAGILVLGVLILCAAPVRAAESQSRPLASDGLDPLS